MLDEEQIFDQAVHLHQAGNVEQASKLYRQLLQQQPQRIDVMHNLGATLLGLGQLREGAELMAKAIAEDPQNPGMLGSPKVLGMELYKSGYWEEAKPWLLEAVQRSSNDPELIEALNRIAPRSYLEPEKYDTQAEHTVLRYSPREADTYVYTIDIVGNCNLGCPSCPVGNSSDEGRFKKMMSLAVFEKVLAKIQRESPVPDPQIWLYNWGEPLLHPKLPEIIGLIHQAGFKSFLSSNLNVEKGLKELIKVKPTELKISISGFSADTYSLTHRKGDINLVKSNLYRLRQYLDKYSSSTRIWVGQHVYKHNHHEVADLAKLCQELAFEHHPIQAFYQPLEKLIKVAEGNADVLNEEIMSLFLVQPRAQVEFLKSNKKPQYDCELRFNQTVINADASVALCCSQYQHENALGVSFLDTHQSVINDLKYEHELCKTCRHHGLDYAPKQLPVSTKVDQT